MKRIILKIYLDLEERDIMNISIKFYKRNLDKNYANQMQLQLLRKNWYKSKSMILLLWRDMIKNDLYFDYLYNFNQI